MHEQSSFTFPQSKDFYPDDDISDLILMFSFSFSYAHNLVIH